MQALHVGGGSSPGSLGSTGSSGILPSGLQAVQTQASPVAGNLGIQKTDPAATRVAHALAGRTHAAATNPAPVTAAN
jgi:hypothetical protein